MSLFDRFRRPRPTSEQLERLSRITHGQQRKALLSAIERGEEIPAYAWEPLPENFDTASVARRVEEQLRTDVGPQIIDAVYQGMGIDQAWSVREARGFTWWGHRLGQRIWAEPARDSDGFAVVRLSAETAVLRNVPNTRELADRLAGFNHHASMSAFVWDPTQASISLRCAAYAHPETAESVKGLFLAACGLQAADAHIKADPLAQLLGGHPAVSEHPLSGPRPKPDNMLSVIEQLFAPRGAGPGPFSHEEFAAAARSRVLPWTDPQAKGLTLRGIVRSADRPSGTGLLTMSGDSRHPQLGSGLLSVLSIPIEYEPDMLLAVSHELNLAEATTATARSYFFGAWCPEPKPRQGLAFASFIPTASCRPGLLDAIGLSMAARAAWATHLIEAASTEMKATREESGALEIPQNTLSRSIGRVLEWQAAAALDRIHQQLGSQGTEASEEDGGE